MTDRRTFALGLASVVTLAGCATRGQVATAPVATGPVATGPVVETLAAAQLAELLAAGRVVLVDVRTPAEFAEVRLAGALNAPLSTFAPASIPQEERRETILMCRTSRRSAQAADLLSRHLNGRVRHLEGGIVAWQQAGLPTVAEPAPQA